MAGKKSFAGGINSLLGGASNDDEEVVKESAKVVEPEVEALPSPHVVEEERTVVVPEPEKAPAEKPIATPQPEIVANKKKRGRKKVQKEENDEETVASFVIRIESHELIKALSYWERKKIKDVLEEALQAHFGTKGKSYLDKALREFRNANPE